MAVVPYIQSDLKLLVSPMRDEGDGKLGMLMVGNTGVNRVRVNCLDFKGISRRFIRALEDMRRPS